MERVLILLDGSLSNLLYLISYNLLITLICVSDTAENDCTEKSSRVHFADIDNPVQTEKKLVQFQNC